MLRPQRFRRDSADMAARQAMNPDSQAVAQIL
jgi:hypothetical protein